MVIAPVLTGRDWTASWETKLMKVLNSDEQTPKCKLTIWATPQKGRFLWAWEILPYGSLAANLRLCLRLALPALYFPSSWSTFLAFFSSWNRHHNFGCWFPVPLSGPVCKGSFFSPSATPTSHLPWQPKLSLEISIEGFLNTVSLKLCVTTSNIFLCLLKPWLQLHPQCASGLVIWQFCYAQSVSTPKDHQGDQLTEVQKQGLLCHNTGREGTQYLTLLEGII